MGAASRSLPGVVHYGKLGRLFAYVGAAQRCPCLAPWGGSIVLHPIPLIHFSYFPYFIFHGIPFFGYPASGRRGVIVISHQLPRQKSLGIIAVAQRTWMQRHVAQLLAGYRGAGILDNIFLPIRHQVQHYAGPEPNVLKMKSSSSYSYIPCCPVDSHRPIPVVIPILYDSLNRINVVQTFILRYRNHL